MPEYLVIPNDYEVDKLLKEYDMTKEEVKSDVAIVRKWMLSQPHLPVLPDSKNGTVF